MTGETFTITKSYKIFQGEPKGEPMDEPNENQLFGWLRARGYSEEEASKLGNEFHSTGLLLNSDQITQSLPARIGEQWLHR